MRTQLHSLFKRDRSLGQIRSPLPTFAPISLPVAALKAEAWSTPPGRDKVDVFPSILEEEGYLVPIFVFIYGDVQKIVDQIRGVFSF